MTDHIVSSYDTELRTLASYLGEMGRLAERLVSDAVSALTRFDRDLAHEVIRGDHRLDDLQRDTEELAILMIAKRQPMARDLREIVGGLRIANDLERIGDLAKNIAKRVVVIGETFPNKGLIFSVDHMASIARQQLRTVMDAHANRSNEDAVTVRNRDEEIDALHTSLFRGLLTYMMEDPRSITQCTHLLFCSKNIERIGDHATNIAETVHYIVTGELFGDDRPKADSAPMTDIPYQQ